MIARRPLAALVALALATTAFATLACARHQSAAPPPARPESEASLPAYAPTPALTGGEEQLAEAAKLPNSAVVAVALVLDNKERCVRIAARGSELYDVGMEGAVYDGRSFAEQLTTDEGEDLAASRAVDAEVRTLLPKIGREVGYDAQRSVGSLHHAQTEICRLAMVRRNDRFLYDQEINGAIAEFDGLAFSLDPALLPSGAEQQRAVGAYEPIVRAAVNRATGALSRDSPGPAQQISAAEFRRKQIEWEKHEREQEQLRAARDQAIAEAQRAAASRPAPRPRVRVAEPTPPAQPAKIFSPPPPSPPRKRTREEVQMRAWHRGYQAGSAAAAAAISTYLEQRDGGLPATKRAACEATDRETGLLLADRFILLAPVPEVETALRAAFGHFQAAAQHCLAGASEAEEQSLAAAQAALARAGELLGRYGLAL